jgi:mannitol-specific phosphotransferase system IIBC component
MKKIIALSLMLTGVVILSGCGTSSEMSDAEKLSALVNVEETSVVSTRPAEINGLISSMEGNMLIVKNEISKEILSEEDAAKQKAERQKMTQEEKQAIKAEETANAKTEDISIQMPVGVVILKGSGDGSGDSVTATYEDLKKGTYVSVWIKDGNVETIKIKGI